MNLVFISLHLVVLNLLLTSALDGSEVFGTQNEDCKPYLSPKNHTQNFNSPGGSSGSNVGELMCPPWYNRDPEGTGECKPGKDFSSVFLFQINTNQTYLQTLYCMTTSKENSTTRRDVVGSFTLF